MVFINSGGVVSLAPPDGDCIAAQEYKKNIVNMFINCRIMKKKIQFEYTVIVLN